MEHTEDVKNHAECASLFSVGLERVVVGAYTITHDPCGDYWIAHKSGEGMQVYKFNFEKLIDDYYKSEF